MGCANRSGETGTRLIAPAASPATGISWIEFQSNDRDETREYIRRNYGDLEGFEGAVAGWMADLVLGAAGVQSTSEFVTARRLAEARRRLACVSAAVRVSTVALDCGFRHFGRFSASYRAAFGESPVETASAGGRNA